MNGFEWTQDTNEGLVPDRINALHYQGSIYNNLNLMVALFFSVALFAVVIYSIGALMSKHSEKIKSLGLYVVKNYLVMISLFLALQIGFCTGIHLLYGTFDLINSSIFALSLAIYIIGHACHLHVDTGESSHFKGALR